MSRDERTDGKSKSGNPTASTKSKPDRRPNAEAASGWSNDMDDEDDSVDPAQQASFQAALLQRNVRRAAEEIIIADIPTILMDEAEETIDTNTQIAVAPEFSLGQIASFQEIEKQFASEGTSEYLDKKIDIAILYNNLHLQEESSFEKPEVWNLDKLFVEIRNSIKNPAMTS